MGLVGSRCTEFNDVNISTALHRVAKLQGTAAGLGPLLRLASESIAADVAGPGRALSNPAWSLATLAVRHIPLLHSISSAAIRNLS
mmetsp:Transcript_35635/g.101811  ORF Transcript_35635/g.101811 Transcript_35635/m.101811 type:complete len:86 (-) Transcript_35635:2-259(-)